MRRLVRTRVTMATEADTIVPPEQINAAVEADRAARKAGQLSSLSNPAEISREVIAALHRHVDPDDVGRVIGSMLKAKRKLKDGTELEDTRSQEAGAKLYLAYTVGMPVQRSENVNVDLNADSSLDIEERMENSPALLAQMEKIIAKVKSRKAQGDAIPV